jgi:hypothetical protein
MLFFGGGIGVLWVAHSGREDGHLASTDSHDSGLHKVLAFGRFGPSCICRLMRCRVRRRNTVPFYGDLRSSDKIRCQTSSLQLVAKLLVSRNSAQLPTALIPNPF